MRIEITLTSQSKINIPKSHNHILQGFIYTLLEPSLRGFLHNQGYAYEKRKFKLFTFSRLTGQFESFNNHFQFIPPVRLFISSPKSEILQSLADGLLKKEKFSLGGNELFIESVGVLPKLTFTQELIIKMLSPVTVYSTLEKSDGSKKTYYYSPFEGEFNTLIQENLRKKYQAAYGKEPFERDFNIIPYKVRPWDEKIVIYNKKPKPTIIKAWMGIYKIAGSPQIVELAYDSGIGSKNSQGFGCWESAKG